MIKKLLLFASLVLLIFSLFAVVWPARPSAAFNKNNIIDDHIFDNANSMNEAQIQAFLDSFPNSCIKNYNSAEPLSYFDYGSNVPASRVIYKAAQMWGINPQVILATLQKEQSIVTGGGNTCNLNHTYNAAMGMGCPDGGECPAPAYAGFSKQVTKGAWHLKWFKERAYGNVDWNGDGSITYSGYMTQGHRRRVAGGSLIYFDGNYTIDSQAVHMDNGATASLYYYTPHFHGNQNFVTIFESWFGTVHGEGFTLAISDDPDDLRQWVVYGSIKQYVATEEILDAWGLRDYPLVTMNANALAAISTGPNLDRLMRHNLNPGILYFVDGAKKYRVTRTDQLTTLKMSDMATSYVSTGLYGLVAGGGNLTFSIKHPSQSTIYMADGLNGSGETVLRPYQSENVFRAWEGDGAVYNTFSSDFFGRLDNAIGSTLTTTKMTYEEAEYQVVNGCKMSQPAAYASLYPGTAQQVSSTTFNRLVSFVPVSYIIRSKSSPALYLVDGGQKHHILWPDLLSAWAFPGAGYHILDDAYVNLIPTGTSIGSYIADDGNQLYVMSGHKISVPSSLETAYQQASTVQTVSAALLNLFPVSGSPATGFIKGANSPQIYLLDNSGKRRLIEWPDKLALLAGTNPAITTVSDSLINNIATAASPGIFVTDGTNKYVFEGGKKVLVNNSIQTDWGLSNPQLYSDGTLDRFASGGTLENELKGGAGYFFIRGGSAYATGDSNIAKAWGLDGATERSPQLVSSLTRIFMLTRFVRSSVNGDNRTFVVTNGDWYTISNAHLVNLGGQNAPIMQLDPAFAPNAITEWPSVIVKAGDNSFYVIDAGGRRSFPHPMIRDQWTNFGNISTVTVDEGFLNLLPYRGTLERAIKGTGPSVYSADTGHKLHIRYPDTYHQFYAPYSQVNDVLLDAMPDGPPI